MLFWKDNHCVLRSSAAPVLRAFFTFFFNPQLIASFILVGFLYPLFEGAVWNGNYGYQEFLTNQFGAPFNDFAGSVVVVADRKAHV